VKESKKKGWRVFGRKVKSPFKKNRKKNTPRSSDTSTPTTRGPENDAPISYPPIPPSEALEVPQNGWRMQKKHLLKLMSLLHLIFISSHLLIVIFVSFAVKRAYEIVGG
jgi:hypothetical protein